MFVFLYSAPNRNVTTTAGYWLFQEKRPGHCHNALWDVLSAPEPQCRSTADTAVVCLCTPAPQCREKVLALPVENVYRTHDLVFGSKMQQPPRPPQWVRIDECLKIFRRQRAQQLSNKDSLVQKKEKHSLQEHTATQCYTKTARNRVAIWG